MGTYRDLLAYQKAYQLALDIYLVTKNYPGEEKYSLVNQIRRSSRSVCSNFAEGYARRNYKDYFLSKLNDCTAENFETEVWIDFSKDCLYISEEVHKDWFSRNMEVRKLLFHMINNPDKYL